MPPLRKPIRASVKFHWMEVYTGEKSTHVYGQDVWLPAETLESDSVTTALLSKVL